MLWKRPRGPLHPRLLALLALALLWLTATRVGGAGHAGLAERFSLVAVRLLPYRTITVVDEVWLGSQGRWRLERRSDGWDNGLVATDDGKRLTVQVPQLPDVLVAQGGTHLDFIWGIPPGTVPRIERLTRIAEDEVLGRRAVLFSGRSGDITVRHWVDWETGALLRDERVDKLGRPVWVQVRSCQPPVAEHGELYRLENATVASSRPATWYARAVGAWVRDNAPYPLRLPDQLPGSLRLEGADVLDQDEGRVVVMRLARGDVLISVFIAPASGSPPTERRLLHRGQTVQAKRVGELDVTLVGVLGKREAEQLFDLLLAAQTRP